MPHAFIVRPACWKVDEAAIARVRRSVFIEEQGVPEELEWEVADSECLWFVACLTDDKVIGICRLANRSRVGRMAVLKPWRGQGVGSAMLAAAIDAARVSGQARVELSAQIHAIPFYSRLGFAATGPEYTDAGIPHRIMYLDLE